MGNALRMGLAGGLMGAMQGKAQQIEQEDRVIQSERLMRAKALEEARLAEIAADNQDRRDVRKHSMNVELEDVRAENRGRIEGEKQSAADRRAAESRAASDSRADKSAAARVRAAEISANRPRGEGTKAKSQLFANDAGEQMWVAPGEKIPDGFYRAPASGKPKPADKPKSTIPPKADPNAPPVPGARKAADGLWYVQKDGKNYRVD